MEESLWTFLDENVKGNECTRDPKDSRYMIITEKEIRSLRRTAKISVVYFPFVDR